MKTICRSITRSQPEGALRISQVSSPIGFKNNGEKPGNNNSSKNRICPVIKRPANNRWFTAALIVTILYT